MRISREHAYSILRKNMGKIALATAAIVGFSLISGTSVVAIVVIATLIVLASLSTIYFNWVSAPVNFELVKLSTIVVAYTHGIFAGLIVGILSTVAGKVLIGRIDEKLPVSVAAISCLAILAGVFSSTNITFLGIALTGLYNISLFGISMASGGDFGWNLPYEATNFAINLVLFTRIAPFLVPLLG